ncbi:uncharacterized protein LOC114536260 [Dendronephthya gigantea]|uniref:uncharacterized protein LOC114536260 n=1 Tax=Dendronephthya gigantea TaxID=151771 RepID=UPI00106C0DD4|nr:uncharacterized protein LOC114536260 [Dendronephthya gigantea]
MKYQLERLGAYSAQKQLEDRVENFFSSDKELLVFQCKPELDGEHMLLARSIIEEKRRSYAKTYQNSHLAKQKKHICILVHLRRGTTGLSATWWQFNYLCSWKQAFLDVIEQPLVAMNEFRSESIEKLLTESSWSFKKFSSDSKCLLWCFNCIKYIKEQRPLDIILKMAKDLFESTQVFNAIQSIVIRYVNEQENYESVAVKVACTKEILINSSTFSSAIEHYLCRLVRNPLAKIIYFLERENAWPTRISDEKAPAEYNDVWCDLISRDTIFDIFKIPDPLGTESYIIDGVRLELSVPFSQVIVRKVNAAKEQVLETYDLYTDEDEEHNLESQDKQMKHYIDIVTNIAPDILDLPGWCLNSYSEDFIDITLASFSDNMKRRERVQIGNKALSSFASDYGLSTENPLYSCIQSHLLMWNFKHQIIDQIRMINLCKPFVEETVVENVIKQFVEKSQREVNSRPIETGSVSPNLTRDDEAISIERTDMETNVECERSENATPNLKRKNEQSQYSEHLYQKKMAKRRKHGMETEFKMIESESSILKNSADKPDDSETDAKGTEYRESESESSDSESSNEESNSSTSESEHDGSEDVHTSNADLETSSMSECFEDVLVTKFCEEMFPSEVLINRDGLESWIRNSSLLLSLAFNVSNQAPAFHFLRLCVDYAKMVQKTRIPTDYLYKLDEIAKELKPEYLDKDGSLQNFKKKLVDPLTSELDPAEERYVLMQKFLAKFHNRFLDTYKDAQSAIPIVENVFSLDREDLVLLMKPVMYSLFYACQTKSSGIFFDMIIDQSVMDNCPILNAIDKIFKECFSKGFIHHDSYPAVLICDVVVSILEFDERCNIQTLTTPECELLKCLRCATNVLNGGENYVGLVLLTSVAFLRVFYTKLSRHIYERKKDISFEEEFIIMEKPTIMEEINSLLALNNARSSSLQIFFLKQLYKTGMTLFDLHQFFSESETFPAVTSQIKQCKVVHKAELVSVQRLQEYREVEAAYVQLEQRNKSDMLNMLLKCRNSAKNRLAVMGFLINTFYIKKAVTNLSHKEEQLAHWFSVVIEEYPVMKQLLLRIIGREKFSHPGLQISPESSAHDIETALLILHITCVVASRVHGEMSPLFQYLIKPKECHNTWLLVDKKRKQRVFDEFAFYNASRPITCSCHMRIKFKENGMQNICPYCGTETSTQANSSEQAKIYNLETKSKEWEECTANMSASVYRALDMIVYACFYAGIATGISSSEDVFPLLPTNEQGSTSASTCKDSADFCFNRVKDDLRCLQTILSCDSRTAVDVMHLVVEECTELIRGKTPGDGIFLTEQQCAVWEKKFATTAKDVLSNALRSSRLKFDESNEQRVLIQELDKYPSDHQKHDRELKRLFRLTKKPSFNELRSTFIDSSREFQEQHKVLALLFSQFDELPYLAHLFPLLRWSRLISSMLTHRISRKEAELKTVDDLIHGRIPGHEKVENEEALKKYLDEFLIAWEGMRDFVDQELPNGTDPMPSLTQHSCFLGYCLTEGDFSIYLQTAIKILQSIQNNILDEMILISTRTRHPALHFLELDENCCAIMSVALQEVKKKDIINFNWPDEFLIFTHKLEYGQGEKIDYDFERIELELANEIAFGKSYLTESPNTFIFSKELFHSSAKMLTKIRELCPKTEPLPEEICLGLHSLKERRIQDAQNLLQHIEGVIFVLNTQSILIQDMKLIEFADKWKSKLPSEFPVHLLPDPIIKLAHIPALYEALEDILVDGTIKGLPRKFRAELTEETKKSLNSLVDHRNGSLKLKLFLTALRRFVFRYLSAEKFLPESHTPLRSCLMEPSLWSPEEAPSPDVIPEKMALGDIYAIITHLEPKSKNYSSVSAGRSRFSKKQKRPGRIVSRS